MSEGIFIDGVLRNRVRPAGLLTNSFERNRTTQTKRVSRSKKRRDYYSARHEHLYNKEFVFDGNGHPMKVGFKKNGLKKLYFLTSVYGSAIHPSDLENLDKIIEGAEFVRKSALYKPRPTDKNGKPKDKIKRFYYYRAKNYLHGNRPYIQVAEEDFVENGRRGHRRYIYAITRRLPRAKKRRVIQ